MKPGLEGGEGLPISPFPCPPPHTCSVLALALHTLALRGGGALRPGQGCPRELLGMSGVRCAPHPGGPWLLGAGAEGQKAGTAGAGPRRCLRSRGSQSLLSPSPWLRPRKPARSWTPATGLPSEMPNIPPGARRGGGANCDPPQSERAPVPRAHRASTPQQRPRICIGIWFNFPRGLPWPKRSALVIKTASSAALLGGCREGGSGVQS